MNISTALRTALLWLLDHLKPSEQPSEQELIEYSRELAQRRIPRLLPPPQLLGTYEPPEKTTDPNAYRVHQLVETGRITALIHTQKLPTIKGLHKTLLRRLPAPEEVQADKWLLDSEPIVPEPESALDQLSQLVETEVKLKAVRQRHEGRGKAS